MNAEEICNLLAEDDVTDYLETTILQMSEEELKSDKAKLFKRILNIRNIAWAREYLEEIRNYDYTTTVDSNVEAIKNWISEAGITLEDIGTSEKELQTILKQSHIDDAETYLRIIRNKKIPEYAENNPKEIRDHWYHIFDNMEECLNEGKITLEEIGTSAEELTLLKKERLNS